MNAAFGGDEITKPRSGMGASFGLLVESSSPGDMFISCVCGLCWSRADVMGRNVCGLQALEQPFRVVAFFSVQLYEMRKLHALRVGSETGIQALRGRQSRYRKWPETVGGADVSPALPKQPSRSTICLRRDEGDEYQGPKFPFPRH